MTEQDELGTKSSTNDEPEEKIISAEADDSGANYQHCPTTTEKSQPSSSTMSTKPRHSHDDEVSEEEDNCSLASSATSARTNKFKVTVPVGPRFTCGERLGKRKEYYAKLEEKHKALEKEKQEAEARQKEEEDAAIKQLRKSMVYKANPVPSFYRDGPPPKVKLKKLPLTRPISPKLTRRRSCSDAGKTEDMRLQERATRQSAAAKGKERVGGRKSDEKSKTEDDSQEQELVDNES